MPSKTYVQASKTRKYFAVRIKIVTFAPIINFTYDASMKKIFLGLLAIALLFSACHRPKKPIQYVRVPVDSTNANDVEGIDTSWMDEPAIIIPEEVTEDIDHVVKSADREYRRSIGD